MDLKRLRYFCGIVEQGSIGKAARVLNIAQPPLSKRLQELEDEVGVTLLTRNGRGMTPTPAGLHLYKRASEMLREMETIKRETMSIGTVRKRRIRIGVSYLFNVYFRPLLLTLYRDYPDVEMDVLVSDTSQLELFLQQKRIDVALIQSPYQTEGYETVNLTPVKTVAVISKALMPMPPAKPFPLSAIDHLPLVLIRRLSGAGTYNTIQDQLRAMGAEPGNVVHVSEAGLVLDLLDGGMAAMALLPESEVAHRALPHCHVVEVYPAPMLFFPAAVKLTSTPETPEVMDIVRRGYPLE